MIFGKLHLCDTVSMAKLKETNVKFDELNTELTKSLESLDQQIQSGLLDDAEKHYQNVKIVTDEIDIIKSKVDDLNSFGEDILTILDALDCRDTPKGKKVETSMKTIETSFNSVQQLIQTKQKKFDDKIFSAHHNWAQKMKKLFNDMKPASLDRDILNEQIQAHREVAADISTRLPDITKMKDRHGDKPAQMKKCKTLLDNVSALNTRAKERGEHLEKIGQKLEPFHLAIYQLESWYSYATHTLKQERVDVDYLFTKVDNVYNQREDKQQYMTTVTDDGKQLIGEENISGQEKLEKLMREMQRKWNEVGDKLVQLVISAALLKIESFGKAVDKAKVELEGVEAPSADPEIVVKQYMDYQASHSAMITSYKSCLDAVNKYKNMAKKLSGNDSTEIQTQWSVALKDYSVWSKGSAEKLGPLEEAQPAQLSADIDMDEVLQDWIELDTVEDAEAKKDEPATGSEANNGPEKPTETPTKKKRAKKSVAAKVEKETSEADTSKTQETSSKTTTEAVASDGNTPNKETKTETTSKTEDSQEVKDKKDAEQAKKVPDAPKRKGSDVKTESPVKKKSPASPKGKKPTADGATEKTFPVDVYRGNLRGVDLSHGIVIANVKEGIRRPALMNFVKPYVTKIGILKYIKTEKNKPHVFIGVTDAATVKKLVLKLNGQSLEGRRVEVLKALVTVTDDEKKKPGAKQGNSAESIFDNPEHKKSSKTSGKDVSEKKSSESSDKTKKKGVKTMEEIIKERRNKASKKKPTKPVLTLAEIKMKKDEMLQEMRQKRLKREGGVNLERMGPDGKKPKLVLTLSQLRAGNDGPPLRRNFRDQPEPNRLFVNPMGRGNMNDPMPNASLELERERHLVWLEQERLERERLEAERERIALQRERQRRELGGFDMIPERNSSPGPSNERRPDGTYWMPAKKPMGFNDMPDQFNHGRRPGVNMPPENRNIDPMQQLGNFRPGMAGPSQPFNQPMNNSFRKDTGGIVQNFQMQRNNGGPMPNINNNNNQMNTRRGANMPMQQKNFGNQFPGQGKRGMGWQGREQGGPRS